jgi:hypothetical protein
MGYEQGAAALRPSSSATPQVNVASAQDAGGGLMQFPAYGKAHHDGHDAMIQRVVSAFNKSKGWDPSHQHYLDANLVKAWALQESGGHADIFSGGDMMQMNNPGDWVSDKQKYLGMQKTDKLSPEESLTHALNWAYYKGETTRPLPANGALAGPGWYPTVRGTERVAVPGYQSKFSGWEKALTKYNGGGVADYYGDITSIRSTGVMPKGDG